MFDVITIGSATRDVFLISHAMHPHRAPDALAHIEACFPFGAKINIDEIHFDTGGGATNNAVTFSRLGRLKVAALFRIGNDAPGREITQSLKDSHVNTIFAQSAKGERTAYSTILSPGGHAAERTILVYRGASSHFDHLAIPWKKMKTKWFYVSSLGGDTSLLKKIGVHAKKIGARVALNPGGQEIDRIKTGALKIKDSITFLILNREEAARLTGVKFENTKGLLNALSRVAPSAIMTDGPQGAYAMHEGESYYIPSVGHNPKNLTGAGDAFGSGFLGGWIKSQGNIKEALRVGAINADSVVQHIGAKVGILKKYPSKKQLTALAIKTI